MKRLRSMVLTLALAGSIFWAGMAVERMRRPSGAAPVPVAAIPAPSANQTPITAERALGIAVAHLQKDDQTYSWGPGARYPVFSDDRQCWSVSLEARPKAASERSTRLVAALCMTSVEVSADGKVLNDKWRVIANW
jgi:hypothetical protein